MLLPSSSVCVWGGGRGLPKRGGDKARVRAGGDARGEVGRGDAASRLSVSTVQVSWSTVPPAPTQIHTLNSFGVQPSWAPRNSCT